MKHYFTRWPRLKRNHLMTASVLACTFAGAAQPCFAAQQPANDQQTLIIIAIAGANTPGNGVAMMRLPFPSVESCEAAAKVMEKDIRGGFVTARCLPTH